MIVSLRFPKNEDTLCWRFNWKVVVIGLIVIWTLLIGLAVAQGGYPQRQDHYVNDYAGALADQDISELQALLGELEQQHGIEAVVVTINSIQDYPVNQTTIESFATNLFNTWGLGDSRTNKGVLILVALTDRKVRLELGRGYGSQYNAAMQEVINEHMLPAFRQNDYSRGIRQGTRAMIAKLTGSWPVEPARADEQGWAFPGLLIGTVAIGGLASLGLVGFGVRRYRQGRRWRCLQCQTVMSPVAKAVLDSQLDAGQKMEQQLRTMRYELRRCPTCGKQKLKGQPLSHSSIQKCPQCQYRTMRVTSQTLQAATHHSTGLKQLEQLCQQCHYTNTSTSQIPMLVAYTSYDSSSSYDSGSSSYDSSSSSSDSGGSSSGDGASGSW